MVGTVRSVLLFGVRSAGHRGFHCNKDMCESAFSFLKWTYQIKPPCVEGASDRYGLQLMRQHVFLASKKLTTFTAMNKGVGVGYDSWPKEPLLYVFPMIDLAPV
jgi:hypothetical protein